MARSEPLPQKEVPIGTGCVSRSGRIWRKLTNDSLGDRRANSDRLAEVSSLHGLAFMGALAGVLN